MINVGVSSGVLPVTGHRCPGLALADFTAVYVHRFWVYLSVSYQNQIDREIQKNRYRLMYPTKITKWKNNEY
jgi:cell division protein FtsW (lipid II flippase)